jgi:preprotein translocase subunit YajC
MRKFLFILISIIFSAVHDAAAMGAPQGEGGQSNPMSMIFLIGGIIAIFYFFMIAPQKKKQKEKEAMLNAVKEGDEIVTAGGIHGIVKTVKESTVRVQVDDHTRMEIEKTSIAGVINKGQTEAK